MSATSLVPKNGAVSFGSFVADYNAFEIDMMQATENVTPYGANTCSKNVGNGTPDFSFAITAYALAHATNTPPTIAAPVAAGVSTTFTLDTGVTEACTMVQAGIRISHGRMRAAVPYAITGKNYGDITETWPTS